MIEQIEKSNRIVFIDLVRAFAILMMVQGHSIELTLNPIYRDLTNPFYSIWAHLRGLTAPTFFFSSGVIFTYLLFKDSREFKKNIRVKKGIRRGFLLILIGYILRLQPEQFTDIGNYSYPMLQKALSFDTLHCIGSGLLMIIALWIISNKTKLSFLFYSIPLAFIILFSSPYINSMNSIKHLPLFFANMFTFNYGSNFPMVPWFTFILLGASFGYLLSKNVLNLNKLSSIFLIAIIGIIVSYFSDNFLLFLFEISELDSIIILYKNNYLLFHIGNVLILISIMALIAKYWNTPSKTIHKIGQNTLMIYIVHIFIIYGTGFTIGLKQFYSKNLNIYQSISMAIAVIIINVLLVVYKDSLKDLFQRIIVTKLFKQNKN